MTPDDSGRAAQLAMLTDSAAATLYELVTAGSISGQGPGAAAPVIRGLESALVRIARTLNSAALQDACPEAAFDLTLAATRIRAALEPVHAAHTAITDGQARDRDAQPGLALLHHPGQDPAGPPVDFPVPAAPRPPRRRGAGARSTPRRLTVVPPLRRTPR